jgi:hypothetical protein
MTDPGRSEEPSAAVDFEVLMEFQRHVKNRFDRSRILWFNAAVSTLAQQQKTTPNDVMKKALTDFDQFVAQVEKKVGPIPSADAVEGPEGASNGDDPDGFDQLLSDD